MKAERQQVLEDVVLLLEQGKIQPASVYFRIPPSTREDLEERGFVDTWTKDLQSAIREPVFTCWACAKGALFVAYVAKFNEQPFITEAYQAGDVTAQLLADNLFSKDELNLMEAAFEQDHSGIDRAFDLDDRYGDWKELSNSDFVRLVEREWKLDWAFLNFGWIDSKAERLEKIVKYAMGRRFEPDQGPVDFYLTHGEELWDKKIEW